MSGQNDWNTYVDNMRQHSNGKMTSGCVVGREGKVWTTPGGAVLNINENEAKEIARCYNKKNFDSMFTRGLFVNGKKYTVLNYDAGTRLVTGASTGVGGIALQATKKTVLIGLCSDSKLLGSINCGLGKVASHLTKCGF